MATEQRRDRSKAFGNTERIQLIRCLNRPKSVSDLLEQCTLSQSALSQHLKVLRDAGVVTTTREGRRVMYEVTSKKMLTTANLLFEIITTNN